MLAAFGWTGCATAPRQATPHAVAAPTPVANAALPPPSDDFLADDISDDANPRTTKPSPEALAHYAAGVSYEWNDDDEAAVKQFDQAALDDPSNERLVIKVAQRYLRTKNFDKAIAVLAKSAKRPNASASLLSWLAQAEMQAGKLRDALSASHLAVQRQPDAFEGYQSEVEVLFQKGQWPEALRALNRASRAIKPDPESLVGLCELYSAYLKAQPKDGAARTNTITLLNRISKMKFTSTRLWTGVADTYIAAGQPKKAADIYLKLLSETPEPSITREALHEKLAGIYFEAEDKTNAMKQLQAIVRDNPTRYPRAWFFLGELAYEDDKLAEAADDYDNALHWDPNMADAYFKLALVQLDMHRTEDAFKTLDIARARFPKTFACECYTGIAYLHVKKYPDAIHHFAEAEVIALASDPSPLDYRFYFQFGEACERNQDYKKAEEYLQKCIDLSPDFAEALNYLGYMFADLGQQLPRARALIEKAIQLEPKNGAYLDSLAWVLFKQKQYQPALKWELDAVKNTPETDATVMDHLGDIYAALHQPAKAIEAWKKSLSVESNPDVKKKLDQVSGGA